MLRTKPTLRVQLLLCIGWRKENTSNDSIMQSSEKSEPQTVWWEDPSKGKRITIKKKRQNKTKTPMIADNV